MRRPVLQVAHIEARPGVAGILRQGFVVGEIYVPREGDVLAVATDVRLRKGGIVRTEVTSASHKFR